MKAAPVSDHGLYYSSFIFTIEWFIGLIRLHQVVFQWQPDVLLFA